jgi:hypothetical protein
MGYPRRAEPVVAIFGGDIREAYQVWLKNFTYSTLAQ